MKTIMILIIASLYFSSASAQREKGQFALSGKTDMNLLFGKTTLSADGISSEKQRSRAFNTTIGFAYFAANNLAVGLSGTFQYKRVDADNSIGYLQNYVAGVIPSITYFFPSKGKLKPTINAGAGYLWFFTSELDAEGLSLNVAPGVSYFINRHISLDLGLQYSYNDLKDNSRNSGITYQQQILGLLAGLSIYF